MIILTLIIGIVALVGAHMAGLTATWLGTGTATAIVLMLCISALPACHFLFDSSVGLAVVLGIWLTYTTVLHRLLADSRRSSPPVAEHRRAFVWQWGRYTVGFAMGVSA
jgi:hypothetical protein